MEDVHPLGLLFLGALIAAIAWAVLDALLGGTYEGPRAVPYFLGYITGGYIMYRFMRDRV